MDHPNVVSLKHCFFSTTSRDELFLNLVMEYVPETLYCVSLCSYCSRSLPHGRETTKCFELAILFEIIGSFTCRTNKSTEMCHLWEKTHKPPSKSSIYDRCRKT
ncbi:hypothetical protein ZWY2020_046539 [Hordeum vulgare]|nr:hypothetical protein ZWY2020_046539 [Hordeum vulgare]